MDNTYDFNEDFCRIWLNSKLKIQQDMKKGSSVSYYLMIYVFIYRENMRNEGQLAVKDQFFLLDISTIA